MAATSKAVIPNMAAVLALASLGACGQPGGSNAATAANGATGPGTAEASKLFADDFKGVCSGATVSRATAYDAAAAGHKAVYFATYKDGLGDRSSALPADWTVQFSADTDAYKAIDLVVCAKRSAAQQVKVCDGYKKDGKPTQNKVRWHTATYKMSVAEATTGKTLAETTLEATNADCPMFQSFDGEADTIDGYASPSDTAVADFLKPHIKR